MTDDAIAIEANRRVMGTRERMLEVDGYLLVEKKIERYEDS